MNRLASIRESTRAVHCADCGKCTSHCPLARWGGFSPRALVGANLSAPGPNGHASGMDWDSVARCLTCGSCETRCPHEVRFSEYVRGVRELHPELASRSCPHGEAFQQAARLMTPPHRPTRSLEWLGEDLRVSEEGEVALFVGCLPFFDLLFRDQLGLETLDIARSAVRLLNHVGVKPVILASERCCGHDLLWKGERGTFEALARANKESYAERGVNHILTTCGECCRTWRVDYEDVQPDYRPRVEHISEFLAPKMQRGELALRKNVDQTVTYQDPCRLGRHLGVLTPPREVLGCLPGTELVEMTRSGRDADCCGTSGFINCDRNSRRMQTSRLESARRSGARKLLTACPKCLIHFRCAQSEDGLNGVPEPAIEVEDFTVYAASMLEASNPTGSIAGAVPVGAGLSNGENR